MKVIIDEREHELYEKCYSIINSEGNHTLIQLSKQVLLLGDVLIKTDEDKEIMIIERKSFADLLASIKDGRYEEQSYRLTHSSGYPLHNIVYIIEGIISQLRTPKDKTILYSAITSLNYFKGFSVMKTASIRETAELIVFMANKIDKDLIKGKIPSYLIKTENSPELPTILTEPAEPNNYCTVVKKSKKENITPENIGEILLCQIPGISSTTSLAIMKPFKTFPEFMQQLQTNSDFLNTISYETNGKTRKINKSSIESIKQYLLSRPIPDINDVDNSSRDVNPDK